MAKTKALCKVCGSKKLVNYAYLCKRCNKLASSSKILHAAAEEHEAMADEETAKEEAADAAAEVEAEKTAKAEAAESAEEKKD